VRALGGYGIDIEHDVMKWRFIFLALVTWSFVMLHSFSGFPVIAREIYIFSCLLAVVNMALDAWAYLWCLSSRGLFTY